jgi:hypothetical protein
MSFRAGDCVKIKQGVKDPDFDADLSGWQGTLVECIDAKGASGNNLSNNA